MTFKACRQKPTAAQSVPNAARHGDCAASRATTPSEVPVPPQRGSLAALVDRNHRAGGILEHGEAADGNIRGRDADRRRDRDGAGQSEADDLFEHDLAKHS